MTRLDIFIIGTLIMLILTAWVVLPVTQEQIDICVSATNYTPERCAWEIGR